MYLNNFKHIAFLFTLSEGCKCNRLYEITPNFTRHHYFTEYSGQVFIESLVRCDCWMLTLGYRFFDWECLCISKLRIVRVNVHVLVNRTVVDSDWRFDNLSAVVISRVKVSTSCIMSVDVDVSHCQQQSSGMTGSTFHVSTTKYMNNRCFKMSISDAKYLCSCYWKVHVNLNSLNGSSFHTFALVKKAHLMTEFTWWGDW